MKRRQAIVLLATLISIFGIYWINAGKTSLKRISEVAGREEIINYTLPPDFSFSIWGLIYLGFISYAVYGLIKNRHDRTLLDRTAYPVAISVLFNLIWTIIVGLEYWVVAYFLQWLMLAFSMVILLRWLSVDKIPEVYKWLSIPFALYAGWLTVAMIPFTSDLLNRSGWDHAPLDARTWAIVLYFTATVIVYFVYKKIKNPFYILPLPWAFLGYFIRFDGELRIVSGILLLLTVAYMFSQTPRFFRPYRAAFVSL